MLQRPVLAEVRGEVSAAWQKLWRPVAVKSPQNVSSTVLVARCAFRNNHCSVGMCTVLPPYSCLCTWYCCARYLPWRPSLFRNASLVTPTCCFRSGFYKCGVWIVTNVARLDISSSSHITSFEIPEVVRCKVVAVTPTHRVSRSVSLFTAPRLNSWLLSPSLCLFSDMHAYLLNDWVKWWHFKDWRFLSVCWNLYTVVTRTCGARILWITSYVFGVLLTDRVNPWLTLVRATRGKFTVSACGVGSFVDHCFLCLNL